MDTQQVVNLFRQRVDDKALPFLYADEDVLAWLSEAQREAAVRARLLFDDASAICIIPIVPGIRRYQINPLIFEVEAVWRDRSPQYPGQRGIRYLLADNAATWRHGDYDNDFYRSAPHIQGQILDIGFDPDVSYVGIPGSFLRLEAYRLPLADIEAMGDDLELDLVHHDGLIDWLLYRAYQTKDGEGGDPARSAEGYNAFETRFGSRPSANSIRQRAEKRRWISGSRRASWAY